MDRSQNPVSSGCEGSVYFWCNEEKAGFRTLTAIPLTAETMQSCKICLHLQLLSLALFAFVELAVGDEQEEVSLTIGNVAPLSCLIPGQLSYDRPVSWYWTPLYPECSGSNGGKILDIYPDGRTIFEEEFTGRVIVHRSKVKKGDYSITLRGIKIPDSGVFICTHEDLSEEKKVRLIVKPGCWSNLHLTLDPPVVSVGDKVTLTCTYCGAKVLTPRIKWQYDGLSISDTGVVSITNNGQSLVISRVDQEHSKKYGCSMAKKESVVTEICLDIELDFLDSTMFAGDYDYPVSTPIPIITSESTTTSATQETTTQVLPTPESTNASQIMWNDLEWMQDTSPVTSLRTESSPTATRSTVKIEETSDPWNEDVNHGQQGSTARDSPVVVANGGMGQIPVYICIILGGILLLIIITFLIKRLNRSCKCGTHDVERKASDPINHDSSGLEGIPLETQDECLVQTGNEDDGPEGTVNDINGEVQEPNKDEDEDTTESEVKEVDVGGSNHAKESEDVKPQDEDQQ
ncbi:uncharacterized protein [Heptranchias perlo]|uniref:uncharacterized protein n=1 Tax=Heptranchias perlo TaxID=212740 RepID=UPI003559CF4F